MNGDGYDDLLIGAPSNGGGSGAAYLVLGRPGLASMALSAASARYTDDEVSTGSSVSGAGDVNGDGYDDMLISSPDFHDSAGAVYLVFGGPSPASMHLSAAAAMYTPKLRFNLTLTASGAGDVNGDGYDDMLIGTPDFHDSAGAVYLVLGAPHPASRRLSAADATYIANATDAYAGYSVAGAGDVNGDGYDDMLIGAPDFHYSAGAVYLVLGSASPDSLGLWDADAKYVGEATGDWAGVSLSGAGDVNGDGYGDLLIGAPGNDDGGAYAGAAYLVLGGADPASRGLSAADAQYTGEASLDEAGTSVASAGDVDGDGYDDLLIGADSSEDGGIEAGAAYLVLGSASPDSLGLWDAGARYTGEASDDWAGSSVGGAGDVNGDGYDDLLIGAPGNDAAGTNAGAAYLLYGGCP